MTLHTILQTNGDSIAERSAQTGEWFVATEALGGKSVEEFTI